MSNNSTTTTTTTSRYQLIFLTLADIKSQLQVVDEIEDDELTLLGVAAEQHILSLINRSALEVVDTYGDPLPADLYQAMRCMVGQYAKYRESTTPDTVNDAGVMRTVNKYRKLTD